MQSANHLLQHGCFFSLGILIWLCSSLGFTATRVAFSGLMIVAGVFEIDFVSQGRLDTFSMWIAPTVWLCCVAAIYASVWSGATGNKITRELGLITYPLYLIHVVLGAAILRVNPWTGRFAALALAIFGALTASWMVVKFDGQLRALVGALLDLIVLVLPNWLFERFSRSTNPLAPPG